MGRGSASVNPVIVMSISSVLKTYVAAVAVFLCMDMVWLGLLAKGVYAKYLGHLMRVIPNWPVAGLFYLLFVVGLVLFVLHPALQTHSFRHAVVFGALFGFFTYMTFDLTSLAVLKDFRWEIALIDMAWGTVLSGSVSALTYQIAVRYFGV